MSEPRAALIYTSLPDAITAREIATVLLEEQLIACANILGEVEAVFRWEGRVDTSREVAVLFKTTSENIDPAVWRLGALHPYATPAIVATICDAAYPDTLEWLTSQTQGATHGPVNTE